MDTAPTDPNNPFLRYGHHPAFDRIRPELAEPAIRRILQDSSDRVEALEREAAPTWEGLMRPLEALCEPLDYAWGLVHHYLAVMNNDAWRKVEKALQPEVVAFGLRIGQSQPVFDAMNALRNDEAWDALSPQRRHIVTCAIRNAELAGVGLPPDRRNRFNEIKRELAELATDFSNAVLDATKAFSLTLTTEDEVAGLPDTLRGMASQAARVAGETNATPEAGPWRITLEIAMFVPFMKHSRRSDLREQLYRAFITRASSGELDNTPRIDRILALRRELAAILGHRTYADVSLATKMAPGTDAVDGQLRELRDAAWPGARNDLAELQELADTTQPDGDEPIRHWDVSFWSERLREQRFGLNEEELRPYFQLPKVLTGLFELAERLFDIRIARADGDVPVWHDDVAFFRVLDADGAAMASFYVDPYSRPETKRGGAWMNPSMTRRRRDDASLQLPLVYIVCNQTPPVGGRPSLMTFREVETLFHEFGHALQHMLTTIDDGGASGIHNIEWDAVELASQFMENWCYHPDTLRGLTAHVETGEPLPDDLIGKILAARTYQSGSLMLRQVYFSMLDMELHHRYRPGSHERVPDVKRRIAEVATIMRPLPEDRFLCGFSHIFAGGYAAGYYSYKWSEVLSADAFSAFEETGLEDADAMRATGRRYRDTVLSLGGSADAMTIFKQFRGREPKIDALLRHQGLDGDRSHGSMP